MEIDRQTNVSFLYHNDIEVEHILKENFPKKKSMKI